PLAAEARTPAAHGDGIGSVGGDLLPALASRGVHFGFLPARGRRGAERQDFPAAPEHHADRRLRRLPPGPDTEGIQVMPAIQSKIDTNSETFQVNRKRMLELISFFRSLEERTRKKSGEAKPLFDKRGQLLPRERIARLLDAGAPWLELSTMAGYCLDNPDPEKSIPGGGMIAGIGYVAGVRSMVVASDSGIDAGAIQHMGREKLLRAQD